VELEFANDFTIGFAKQVVSVLKFISFGVNLLDLLAS
jgi:hypothetical protein